MSSIWPAMVVLGAGLGEQGGRAEKPGRRRSHLQARDRSSGRPDSLQAQSPAAALICSKLELPHSAPAAMEH
ncbi:unnamed protein product [Urochloa humidicola]